MNKFARRAELNSQKKLSTEQRIAKLEFEILNLKDIVYPLLREQEAIQNSKNKFIASCDASYSTGITDPNDKNSEVYHLASAGIVMRAPFLLENLNIGILTKATDSNEAELNAIYIALSTIVNGMHIQNISSDSRIKSINIVTDSKYCVDYILNINKEKTKLINKIETIQELAINIKNLTNKPVEFIWKKRNSTTDLEKANELAQELLGVSNR